MPPADRMKQTKLFMTGPAVRLASPSPTDAQQGRTTPVPSSGAPHPSSSSRSVFSETSSILSSAEAYERRDKKVSVKKEPFEVKVHLDIRLVNGGGGILVSTLSLKRQPLTIGSLTSKRRKYDDAEKKKVVATAREFGVHEAVRRLSNTPGYELVDRRIIQRWRQQLEGGKAKKKPGRKGTSDAFNVAVLGELVYASVESKDDAQLLRIEANVAYSHAVIKIAAQRVQAWPQFRGDKKVEGCKFGANWIKRWLREVDLHRRRITTTAKTLPLPAEVQAQMLQIQERLDDFELDEVISADETGVIYCQQPLSQYVPRDAERAVAEKADDKARLTAMLWGHAMGGMGPLFAIIKCSSKAADLSGTRVLQTLHQVTGFRATEGWTLKTWKRTLTIKVKQVPTEMTFIVPYLIHEETQAIITIQHKAWMDTCRVCMWIDLQLGPYYAKKRGRCALVWDNCGPHGVQATCDMCDEWGIHHMRLPKNMTDILQVMDLVVNSPMKAGARRERCERLFEYFQSWKIRRLQAQVARQEPPKFDPPKPTVADGLLTLIKVLNTTLATEQFQKSMSKCFEDVGLAPVCLTHEQATYRVYEAHKRGSLNKSLWNPQLTVPEGACLADAVEASCEMEILTRLDAQDDLDDADADADACESDEDDADDEND